MRLCRALSPRSRKFAKFAPQRARVRESARRPRLPLIAVLANPPDWLRTTIPAGAALAGGGGCDVRDFRWGDDVGDFFDDLELGGHVRLLCMKGVAPHEACGVV